MTAPRKKAAAPLLEDPTPTEIHPKVVAASAAGAVGIVAVWIADVCGLEMPGETGAAIGVLLAGLAAYLKSAPPWVRR